MDDLQHPAFNTEKQDFQLMIKAPVATWFKLSKSMWDPADMELTMTMRSLTLSKSMDVKRKGASTLTCLHHTTRSCALQATHETMRSSRQLRLDLVEHSCEPELPVIRPPELHDCKMKTRQDKARQDKTTSKAKYLLAKPGVIEARSHGDWNLRRLTSVTPEHDCRQQAKCMAQQQR